MKITSGTLSQRGNSWLWRYSQDGKRKNKSFNVLTRKQAEALRDAYIRKFLADPDITTNETTIEEICKKFKVYAETYYAVKLGRKNTSFQLAEDIANTLQEEYGSTKAVEFGPLLLKEQREKWVKTDILRSTVNRYVSQVKRIFKWAASEELVPASTYNALCTVEGLRKGRSEAKERTPRTPVKQEHIDAVYKIVPPQIQALINLQIYTAARPSELLNLRPCNIDMSGEVWVANLSEHKTEYLDKEKIIYFGPQSQQILKNFLDDSDSQSFLFSPIEAQAHRNAKKKTHRPKNAPKNIPKTDRFVGNKYTAASYRRLITRACTKAKIPEWTPYQLRHNAATYIRKHFGLEAAQIILGHSRADVTQIYAERDMLKAIDVIKAIG